MYPSFQDCTCDTISEYLSTSHALLEKYEKLISPALKFPHSNDPELCSQDEVNDEVHRSVEDQADMIEAGEAKKPSWRISLRAASVKKKTPHCQ